MNVFAFCKLKLRVLPLVMQEVETISERYLNIFNSLLDEETPDKLLEYNKLRDCISFRIVQLDDFYEINFGEENIEYFELARLRLKKLLMFDIYTVSRINDYYNDINNMNNHNDHNNHNTDTSSFNYMNNYNTKDFNYNNSNIKGNNINNNVTNTSQLNKSKIRSSSQIGNNNNNDNSDKRKNGSVRMRATYNNSNNQETKLSKKLEQVSNKNVIFKSDNNTNTSNKNNDYYEKLIDSNPFFKYASEKIGGNNRNNWKEVTFKMQLTENEYKLLILEKANKVKLN